MINTHSRGRPRKHKNGKSKSAYHHFLRGLCNAYVKTYHPEAYEKCERVAMREFGIEGPRDYSQAARKVREAMGK